MAAEPSGSPSIMLQRTTNWSGHEFATPSKKIHDGDGLTFFLSSTAYRDLMTWILQLNRSMFPAKDGEGNVHESRLDQPPEYSKTVQDLRSLISDLSNLVEKAPPDTGPRRFGNVAFRTWHKLVEEHADELLESHLGEVLGKFDGDERVQLKEEVKFYLLSSLGSAQRLDYGTGHELSFLAFLGCLWKLGAFADGEESAIVIGNVQPYLELIRRVVLTYTLEPAGSHGVWGLDDHSFIPYIFGSAQYGPPIALSDKSSPPPIEGSLRSAPSPSRVTNKDLVSEYQRRNMYFSAIQFIYDVKKGPFWEHSPVLYDISGIKDGWAKINKGMLKMYAAEVLGKFPVVQHFGFGSLFRWEADPEAAKKQASLHAQHQPAAGLRSMDVPPAPASGAGTKAPWAGSGAGAKMPSTRAPFVAGGVTARMPPSAGSALPVRGIPNQQLPPDAGGIARPMPPPGSAAQRGPPGGSDMNATKAPWAKKDGA